MLASCTPSCLRTATRHSHGRSCPFAFARAGVNSQGKSGAIELDRRKAIRLEVRRVRTRIGAHDLVRVDADDVGGSAQPDGNRRQRRVLTLSVIDTSATAACLGPSVSTVAMAPAAPCRTHGKKLKSAAGIASSHYSTSRVERGASARRRD